MDRLYTYDEYKAECLKNKYSKENYDSRQKVEAEKHMKKAYESYVFRYNALKQAKEYENEIREKYNKLNKTKADK